MINKTTYYWSGDNPADLDEWLRAYTEDPALEVRPVLCRDCGQDAFALRVDQNEGAVQVQCAACGAKRIILDGQDIWADARPRLRKCRICKTGKHYNVRVGLTRRENGSVKWVYVGSRCTGCGALGSYADWKINYEPTDALEENI